MLAISRLGARRTRLGGTLRRPKAERTQANKETAIAYAAYRTLLFVFPEDADWLGDVMRKQGLDSDDTTVDPRKPAGIGTVAPTSCR